MEATQSELVRVSSVLYSRLSGGPLAVYEAPAPRTIPDPTDPTGVREIPVERPFIAYDLTPQSDVQSKQSVVWSRFEAVVRVVGLGSLMPLDEHLRYVDQAMGGGAGISEGGVGARRTGTFSLPVYFEEGGDQPVREAGFRYQVKVS